MKTNSIVACLLFIAPFATTAQTGQTTGSAFDYAQSRLAQGVSPVDGIIRGVPRKNVPMEGTYFYDDSQEFFLGDLKIKGENGVFADLKLRYNLKNFEVEVNFNDQIRAFTEKEVESFSYVHGIDIISFVSTLPYPVAGVPLQGFFQLLADGPAKLLKYKTAKIVAGNMVPQLGADSGDPKIVQVSRYYVAINGETVDLPTGKKKLFALFGEQADAVANYASENNLSIKKERDLARIFNYFNTTAKQ